jgi:hypothetical protein
MAVFEKSRHVPLRPLVWDPGEAANAIQEIVSDALDHFDLEGFWPAHPLEDGMPDGNTSLYCGATGMIWALQYLARIGATETGYERKMHRMLEEAPRHRLLARL